MSNDPVDGGTVTYHRADYRPGTDEPWLVWFTEDQADPYWFTAEQGEAMGLTPPEPAPLVVECRGHRIELSDLEADVFQRTWAERAMYDIAYNRACDKLARLLRDARQDPQPTADTPSDDIDFDALPIGTVCEVTLLDGDRLLALKMDGIAGCKWFIGDSSDVDITKLRDVRVVYQPPPLSPRQHLEALLAGRDDADELIKWAARWGGNAFTEQGRWHSLIGDAARGGAKNG